MYNCPERKLINMPVKNLSNRQKTLRRKVLELTYQANTCHLGSCLSVIDILDAIYKVKSKDDKMVLSNGHAAAALYVVLEKNGYLKNPSIKRLHVHPDRNPKIGIDVSTGSLGQGLPIAVGMALAERNKRVYCVISDGECSEGSVWEALQIAIENNLSNLIIIVNANGWAGYDRVDLPKLVNKLKGFGYQPDIVNGHKTDQLIKVFKIQLKDKPSLIFAKTSVEQLPFLNGQDAHYYIMKPDDYLFAMKLLK